MNDRTMGHMLLGEMHQEVKQLLGEELNTLNIRRVVVGLFFSGVILDNGVGGMCATPIKSIPEAVCCPSSAKALPVPGKLCGKSAAHMLEDLYRDQELRRTLAIATLNALTETLWLRDGAPSDCEISSGDAFAALNFTETDEVALVGAFPPYMRALRKAGQDFRVLEKDPATLKADEMPYYAPADTASTVVPWADVLVITGTTLINGTLDTLLGFVKAGTEVAVIGPTAPLLMRPFSRHGVTVVGGTRVRDAAVLLDLLAEGASGYHFFEKAVERVTLRLKAG